jgi:hypothetical protein
MGTVPTGSALKTKRSWYWGALAVMILVLVCLYFAKRKIYDNQPQPGIPQIADIDPLCQTVENLQLKCVVTPAAAALLGPGNFVDYSQAADPHAKVPFPEGNLFSKYCLVPGAPATDLLTGLNQQEGPNKITIRQVDYKLDRGFKAGAELPIPRLANLEFKAGPKLTEVEEISLVAPNAWLQYVDENQFLDLLAKTAIVDRCINDVIANHYSVVSKAAIAKDMEIILKDNSGQSFGLSAAVKKGEVSMNAGGDVNADVDQIVKQVSETPVVLGVGFFKPELFRQRRAELVGPIFKSQAHATASAAASDASGQLWQDQRITDLGQTAQLHRQGSRNVGPCGPGVPSTTFLTTTVDAVPAENGPAPQAQTLSLTTTGALTGGVSLVPPSNPFIRSCQGHDAQVKVSVAFQGMVQATVRSAEARILEVSVTNLSAPEVKVEDWNGNALPANGSDSPEADAERGFRLSGPGIYNVQVLGERTLTASGASTVQVNDRSIITVKVH